MVSQGGFRQVTTPKHGQIAATGVVPASRAERVWSSCHQGGHHHKYVLVNVVEKALSRGLGVLLRIQGRVAAAIIPLYARAWPIGVRQ
jgi:hypothetical protein